MQINTNMAAKTAQNGIYKNYKKYVSSLEKLSTGLRINRASDDAGGLSVSENLRSQINGLNMADRNAQNGISALQVAEGTLNEVSSVLQRMRELAVESSSDTLTTTDRGYLNSEFNQLRSEVDRIAGSSEFNSKKLLDGSWTSEQLHIGPNNTSDDKIIIAIDEVSSSAIGIDGSDITDTSTANTAIDTVDTAIGSINSTRSSLGSYVNRLEYSINNIKTSELNITAAESLIRDVDIAQEMYEFTRSQLNMQLGTKALSSSFELSDTARLLFGLGDD